MPSAGPVAPTATAACQLRPLPLGAAWITGGVWAARQRANRAAIRAGRPAAGVYQWLEAAAWEYAREPAADLLHVQHDVTAAPGKGQAHLIQAAIARVRGTGDHGLLQVAVDLADQLGAAEHHPALAMALVELFRETDNRRHLELAREIVDAHGPAAMVDQLAAGAADVAIEQDDRDLLDALARHDPTGSGGLPWAWRMLLATGEPHYADLAEGMLDGADMRTLSSLDSYLATTDADGVQLHLYAPSQVAARLGDGQIHLTVETDYPRGRRIRVIVDKTPLREWSLSIRVPAWAGGAQLCLGDNRQRAWAGTYADAVRKWRPGDVVDLVLR
jgi:DUF1680 family protein